MAGIVPKLDLNELLKRGRQSLAEDEGKNESAKKDPSGPHNAQKKLKEALKVARSIAKSTGKGRVERPFGDSK